MRRDEQSGVGQDTERDRDDASPSMDTVLDALADADCRAILDATTGTWMTVGELADACGLPLSTAYRKVDVLERAALLDRSVRIRRSGDHCRVYTCAVQQLTLDVAADGLALTLDDGSSAVTGAAPTGVHGD
jgi:DNA-binding transcriptional ArsR family regulator